KSASESANESAQRRSESESAQRRSAQNENAPKRNAQSESAPRKRRSESENENEPSENAPNANENAPRKSATPRTNRSACARAAALQARASITSKPRPCASTSAKIHARHRPIAPTLRSPAKKRPTSYRCSPAPSRPRSPAQRRPSKLHPPVRRR